jgi:hypothetical protein
VKLSPVCNAACLKATACRWQGDNERGKDFTVLENLHLLVIVYSAEDSIPKYKRRKGRQKKIVDTKDWIGSSFCSTRKKNYNHMADKSNEM